MDTIEEVEFDYEAYTRDNPPDLSKFRPSRKARQERREAFRARLINHVNVELKHAREMGHVFISYCHENMDTVDRLSENFISRGINVWLDRNALEPGTHWKRAIQQAIHQGAYFIACFSEESNAREQTYMSEELTLAVEKLRERPFDKVWFIPVKLNECEIPDIDIGDGATLRDLQYVNLYEDWETGIQRIVNVMLSASVQEPLSCANESEDKVVECVLLRSEDGIPYFIPFQKVRWDATEISLTLVPASSAQTAFLSSLRTRLNNVPDGSSIDQLGAIAFAHQEDAAWVKLREVTQISTEKETVWEVVLKEETVCSAYKHRTEQLLLEELTLGEVADMRARRLLLDEKLETASSSLTQTTVFDQMLFEAQIRGELSSQYGNRLQALASPIPELYQQFKRATPKFEPKQFKNTARLIAVLYLKLSNTVEDILQLDIELLNSTELRIKFRGRHSQSDVNEDPIFLEFEGVCPLPK